MAAQVLRSEIWLIDQSEADQLADALVAIMEQYDMTIDPKIAVWLQLVAVSATVYGPRIMAIQAGRL